ncbi:MAG: hypothetical protein K0R15_1561 [Clostridiales bacterium]|jgi:hypothetical protein|nr:hypothetical protein [Clostridiales bacterium]
MLVDNSKSDMHIVVTNSFCYLNCIVEHIKRIVCFLIYDLQYANNQVK